MSLLATILEQMSSLRLPQRKFVMGLLTALSCFAGRANRTNLRRYGAASPRTQYRWAHRQDRSMDWTQLNLTLLQRTGRLEQITAAVIDASFLPKSGKHTYGLASFWDSCEDRAHRGLELSLLALVEGNGERAWALNALQTPAELGPVHNRTTHYLAHLRQQRHALPEGVRHILADSLYANQAFIWGVLSLDLHLVSKLRKDANLRYLYDGPYSGRGRRRQYEGKVDYKDWSRWQPVDGIEPGYEAYTAVVNHVGFAVNLRVVVVFPSGNPDKRRVLMSTDLELSGAEVLRLYASRFQIEFIFRDAKQFAGLTHGQMRDQQGIDFHLNASMAALNFMRAEHILHHDQDVISIASIKRRHYNDQLIQRLFSKLDIDTSSEKVKAVANELRDFGSIAA